MEKNLEEYSEAYYNLNKYYEIFSKAEDYPNLIEKELRSILKGRTVLDAGCGTGKYLEKFKDITSSLYGIDLSNNQLEIAKTKVNKDTKLICSDLEKIALENKKFDVIYSSWVLGTITSVTKRNKVFNELKRILKPNGVIILIENNIGGEFEEIRERYPNIDKTKKYNDWIISKKFKILKEINTYFKFKSDEEAREVFTSIYGKEIAAKAKKKIEHKVIIYYFTN